MSASAKIRIDQHLVQSGLVPSRERARALILAGRVLVNEQKVDKPGSAIPVDSVLRILGEQQRYVSRGGLKLEAALCHWKIPVTGRDGLDIGTSTGGFTDCLLQHGAATVSCVDTGFGQIAVLLRNDPRVYLYERTNARLLPPGFFAGTGSFPDSESPGHRASAHPGLSATAHPVPTRPVPTLLVMDVSFISATLLLPAVLAAAPTLAEAVILVKPQFEAGREHVGKGGIVRDPTAHRLAIERVAECMVGLNATAIETIPSPITGAEGNVEFLLHAYLPQNSAPAG